MAGPDPKRPEQTPHFKEGLAYCDPQHFGDSFERIAREMDGIFPNVTGNTEWRDRCANWSLRIRRLNPDCPPPEYHYLVGVCLRCGKLNHIQTSSRGAGVSKGCIACGYRPVRLVPLPDEVLP